MLPTDRGDVSPPSVRKSDRYWEIRLRFHPLQLELWMAKRPGTTGRRGRSLTLMKVSAFKRP